MVTRRFAPLALVVSLLSVAAFGCSHQAKALSEAALRTAASTDAAKIFSDHGDPIKGNLTCKSTIQGHNVALNCTGVTTDGRPVTAKGLGVSANHDTALKGQWTGEVAGQQVFQQSCVGPSC